MFLASCESNTPPAEVLESHWVDLSQEKQHKVQEGETLFAIAFKYEKDYLELAKINNIAPPYDIQVGQILSLKHLSITKFQESKPKKIIQKLQTTPIFNNHWNWPVHGKVIQHYNPIIGNKGIEILTKYGANVTASATGTVAYAGSGLLGYGKLIIIKHNNNFLSAYANNSQILVHEGDKVHANQIIARAGRLDATKSGLHFEIRKNGKPLNPLQFIH